MISCASHEVAGVDIICKKKKSVLLSTVDNYCKFPIMKKSKGLSADDLIRAAKITFAEFGLPNKIVSDAGTNFVSDKFKQFCRQLNID